MTCHCATVSEDCIWYPHCQISGTVEKLYPRLLKSDFATIERRVLLHAASVIGRRGDPIAIYDGGKRQRKPWARFEKQISQTEAELAVPEHPPSNRHERRAAAARRRR